MNLELKGPAGEVNARADAHDALLVQQSGSAYEAAVERGNVFMVAAQATVVTQAGLSATTPAMTINNRANSEKIVKLWYAGWATLLSATAAFQAWLAYGDIHATAVVETTPSTTVRNAKTGVIGAPAGIGVSVVATLPAAPVAIALLDGASSAAVTAALLNAAGARWFNGALWVPPGANISVQTSTAGSIFTDFIFEVVDK